jgi:uncharacterized protein YaaQ
VNAISAVALFVRRYAKFPFLRDGKLWCACFVIIASGWFAEILVAAESTIAPASHDLRIYFVDVEGGQATLFVTPVASRC